MKKLSLFAAGLLGGIVAASAVQAQVIGIATDQQGSLGYNTGQAVAKIATQEAGLTARIQPLAGTAAYLPLINRGEMDFGFCNAVEAEYAMTGTGNFEGQANPDLMMVGVMFPLKTGLMVTTKSGIKTIEDLKANSKGLKIAAEYTASTIIKYYIMGALANGGMTYDDFQPVPVSNFVKGMEALGDGLVDVTLISLNSAGGKKVDAQLQSDGGITYVSLDNSPEGQRRFKEFLPAASIITLPKNDKIPGLTQESTNIVQIPWAMVTSKNASEEMVYNMTKAVAENYEKLGATFGAFKGGKPDAMAPASNVPYHPGALKYYKEKGIKVGG